MPQQKHENALTSLLATPDGYLSTDRPKKVTLPDAVHGSVIEAVQETHADGRERKVGYRYRYGQWVPGIKRTGSAIRILPDGQPTVANAGSSLYVFRPAIHMHTHPTPDPDSVVKSVDLRVKAAGAEWDDDRKKELSDRESRFHAGSHMLPSGGDIAAMHSISFGTVGNMIASSGGLFLAVRDLNEKEYLNPPNPEPMKNDTAFYELLLKQVLKQGPSSLIVREVILGAAAKVLSHRYTTYFSDDPENPNLARVDTN